MHVLHILRSEPDETVVELMAAFTEDRTETIALFEDDVDWERLVDRIFTADKVICWW